MHWRVLSELLRQFRGIRSQQVVIGTMEAIHMNGQLVCRACKEATELFWTVESFHAWRFPQGAYSSESTSPLLHLRHSKIFPELVILVFYFHALFFL